MKTTFLETLRQTISHAKKWPRGYDRSFTLPSIPSHGWLLPTLIECESLCWGRWEHWSELVIAGSVGDTPIPPIEFNPAASGLARKMHENALNSIGGYGSWQGWGSWNLFDYYLDWLLYGFGHPGHTGLPKEPETGAFHRLYQTLCLEAMIAWPADVLGDMLAENRHGRAHGFYPTPHDVVEMMVRMLMGNEDCRAKSVCDPCLGTGRMLLHASNHSYNLYGMDINATVIKVALVNGYCFAPWLVRPFAFLGKRGDPESIGDSLMDAAQVRPDAAEYLAGTEHDSRHQYQFEPVIKRVKKGADTVLQGVLL